MRPNALLLAFALFSFFLGSFSTATADLLTWWKFDEAPGSLTASDSSGNGNDGTLSNFDFSADSDFDAGGKFEGAIHFDGIDDFINNTTGFQPAGDFTYAYFFKPDEADYTVGHGRDDHIYSNARPHFSFSRDGGGDGQLGMYLNIGGDTQVKSTTGSWSNTEWHFVAWTYDGAEAKMYVNGVLEGTVVAAGLHTVQGDGRFNLGSNAGNSPYDGFMDDLSVWDEALTAADLTFINDNGVEAFLGIRNVDSDMDGLPDTFEQQIIDADPDDAIATLADVHPGEDFDNDASTNAEELDNFTDPTDDDSDDDGLLDGVETNDGTFTDANNTGTNPNNPDTDGDSLSDGTENGSGVFNGGADPGTNPNLADTDGDDFDDDVEISLGTDPTDAGDAPVLTNTVLFIGGQAGPTQGADAAVMTFLQERYGAANVTYQQASATNAGDENAFSALVISSTPGSGDMRNKFHNSPTPAVNWEEATADSGGGEYGMSSVQMTKSTTMTMMDLADHPITAGLPSTIEFATGGETTNTTELFPGLTAVATAANGTGSAGPGNGVDIIGNPALFIADTGDAVNPGAGITGDVAPARRVMFPMTDSTFNSLTDDGKLLLGQSIDWAMGILNEVSDFQITRIGYDATTSFLTLEWKSDPTPGTTYTLLFNEDVTVPLSQWPDLDDGIPTGGETTTTLIAANPDTVERLFFVVKKNP